MAVHSCIDHAMSSVVVVVVMQSASKADSIFGCRLLPRNAKAPRPGAVRGEDAWTTMTMIFEVLGVMYRIEMDGC